jgi:hypothetical protein
MMIGDHREMHDAETLADFKRQADALAKYVEEMEESARKRALKRSVASVLDLLDKAHRRNDIDISAH